MHPLLFSSKGCKLCCYEENGPTTIPVQLDFGTPLDTKAAAHAVRLYLANLPPTSVLVKFDF